MAHLADDVVPRLRLSAAWGQARDLSPVDRERAAGVPRERVLARRELDLSRLGPAPRLPVFGLFDRVARLAATCDRDARGRLDRSFGPIVDSNRADVLVDV